MLSLSRSSHHPSLVFPRPSPPLPLFILLAVQQAPEPRGKSCSQGNGNSPQSWYQNSLKCELSDSSQWVQSRAKHFQIPLPAECKQSRGWERASEPVVFLSHNRARSGLVGLLGRDQGFQNFCVFFKLKEVCLFVLKKSRVCRWWLWMGKYFVRAGILRWTRPQQSYFFTSKINNSEKTMLYFPLKDMKWKTKLFRFG